MIFTLYTQVLPLLLPPCLGNLLEAQLSFAQPSPRPASAGFPAVSVEIVVASPQAHYNLEKTKKDTRLTALQARLEDAQVFARGLCGHHANQ